MNDSDKNINKEKIEEIEREEKEVADLKNVDDFSETEKSPSQAFSISSYGADYTVDSLVKRLEKDDFFVPAFQRSFIWNMRQASRFVESLLMGLPVPGVFVFRESDTNRHLIIDGQQRLKSLQFFFKGKFPGNDKTFRLLDVREPWNGNSYEDMGDFDKRRLDDSIIHTTIFRQEQPQNNDDSVYEVFERINTGGMKLSPQEIRVCVNFGPFTNLLATLNDNKIWRAIYGPISPRLKDQELILRFFAFYAGSSVYKSPLRTFLNRYMEKNRKLDAANADELKELFISTVEKITESVGLRPFRPERAINAAVFDAVSVAIARSLRRGAIEKSALKVAYDQLLANKDFQATYSRATADEENVKARFRLATGAFEAL